MTKADKRENIIMIASEPLTFERSDWMEVKTNTMIVITPKVCSRLVAVPLRSLFFFSCCYRVNKLMGYIDEPVTSPHH